MSRWSVVWVLSGLLFVGGALIPIGLIWSGLFTTPPTLGDWGDYTAACVALIAFVWLVGAQLDNSDQLRKNQEEIEATNQRLEEQLALLSSVASALGRIAGASAVHAGKAFADLSPQFVCESVTSDTTNRGIAQSFPSAIKVSIRNDGERVQVYKLTSLTGGVSATLTRPMPFDCLLKHGFGITLVADKPLKDVGTITCAFEYRTVLDVVGHVNVILRNINTIPELHTQPGEIGET